mmetsp:Transcript_6403/g.12800  ORF Transcript_6403/g.12800 Transcript_6403/m.12800 type:complete len:221 (-) Transcript_6403:716-1378(-)
MCGTRIIGPRTQTSGSLSSFWGTPVLHYRARPGGGSFSYQTFTSLPSSASWGSVSCRCIAEFRQLRADPSRRFVDVRTVSFSGRIADSSRCLLPNNHCVRTPGIHQFRSISSRRFVHFGSIWFFRGTAETSRRLLPNNICTFSTRTLPSRGLSSSSSSIGRCLILCRRTDSSRGLFPRYFCFTNSRSNLGRTLLSFRHCSATLVSSFPCSEASPRGSIFG